MSTDQTSRRAALRASVRIALLIPIAGAAAAAASAAPSPRVERFVGPRAAAVLARANRLEVFRVQNKRAGDRDESLGGYVVAGAGGEQGEASARRLADLLLDEKSYRFDQITVGGFTPLIGFRLWDGERSVEVLVSFATDEAVVLSRNPGDGSVRSAQADVAPAREVLVALVKQALPDDAAAKALESPAQSSAADESSTRSSSGRTAPR